MKDEIVEDCIDRFVARVDAGIGGSMTRAGVYIHEGRFLLDTEGIGLHWSSFMRLFHWITNMVTLSSIRCDPLLFK